MWQQIPIHTFLMNPFLLPIIYYSHFQSSIRVDNQVHFSQIWTYILRSRSITRYIADKSLAPSPNKSMHA